MSVAACAEIVRRGDPDRFLAAMAAPVTARAVLFPIYAFNVEVARAPWMSSEPLIGEMRLQWWRDVLDEMEAGAPPRRHEVVSALSAVAQDGRMPLGVLRALVDGHAALVAGGGMDSGEALFAFLEQTGGGLMWASAAALGAAAALEGPVRGRGWASGLAAYLRAIPELEARGRRPLPDGRPEAVLGLARAGRDRLREARRVGLPAAIRPAALAGWRADATFARVLADPRRAGAGALAESEFRRRASLMWRAATGSV